MFIEFTTTITHRIDIGDNGIESITHSATIDAGEEASALGAHNIYMIAAAGCEASMNSLRKPRLKVAVEIDDEIDDEEVD